MMTIISILFLGLLLLNIYIFFLALMENKRKTSSYSALGLILISLIILYSSTLDAALTSSKSLSALVKVFQGRGAGFHLVFFLLTLTLSIFLLYKENQYGKNTITSSSIKESMDNLPTALSFSTKKGLILLSNRTMNRLCHIITGEDLQDAEAFWHRLAKEPISHGMDAISGKQSFIVHLDTGQTWTLDRQAITVNNKDIIQITGVDTTELGKLRSELEKKNQEITKLNHRLRLYSQNLASIKAKEERLVTKTRLHNELGHILLAARRLLAIRKFDQEADSVLTLWKENIGGLLEGRGIKEKDAFDQVLQAASDLGIKLRIEGEIPREGRPRDFILAATVEALNNALRHGHAGQLNLNIEEGEGDYLIEFTNDGRLPEGEITEGGGLPALRRKIEGEGGRMEINIEPAFKLWLTIPKRKEVPIYEKSFNC